MNKLMTLVKLQLRDKIDLSFLKNKKEAFRGIILGILEFIVIAAVVYGALFFANKFSLFYYDESIIVVIILFTLTFILSTCECTFSLMKTLYFSEDNKVLITFPVTGNIVFTSKLIVFVIYELRKSFKFIIPIIFASALLLVNNTLCTPWVFLWMWLPIFVVILFPVLFGAILSIPLMYIYRFFKKYSVFESIFFIILLGLGIWGLVALINLIPEHIDLITQWPTISKAIHSFLIKSNTNLPVMSQVVYTIMGERTGTSFIKYSISYKSVLKLLILLGAAGILTAIVYLASRPLFFKVMSKNFETLKSNNDDKPNRKLNKYVTFLNKELIINLRTMNISVNYLMVYMVIPILTLLLNKIYRGMDLNSMGERMSYAFNILMICLPMLASNALIATYYSREGRAGYVKKTKPIYAVYPLLAKLVFNVGFSIITIFVSVGIFGGLMKIKVLDIVLLGFGILFIHIGHMFYSAMLDIMNPQNEQYATTGDTIDNPNENKATIFAFVISALFALIAYRFIYEASLGSSLDKGFLKLMLVGLAYMICSIYMFVVRIKAYYYDIQG